MHSLRLLSRLVTLAATLACAVSVRAAAPPLPLKDNDVWVMAGDSIEK